MPNRALAPPGSWDASGLGDKVFGHCDTLMWQFEMGSTIDRGGGGLGGSLCIPLTWNKRHLYMYISRQPVGRSLLLVT